MRPVVAAACLLAVLAARALQALDAPETARLQTNVHLVVKHSELSASSAQLKTNDYTVKSHSPGHSKTNDYTAVSHSVDTESPAQVETNDNTTVQRIAHSESRAQLLARSESATQVARAGSTRDKRAVKNERSNTLLGIGSLLPPFIVDSFGELVKMATDSCEILPLDVLYSRQYTAEMPLLDLVEFRRGYKRAYRVTSAHLRLLEHNPPSSLVLYIPGWWNTPTDEASRALVKALLDKHETILIYDTRPSFCRGYVSAASRVQALAYLLYGFIKELHQNGYPMCSIHLIGFSLGAHVAGVTGKYVQKGLNTKIGKITGLDPARPCFSKPSKYRLSKKDANFVHVIHSSAGVIGLEQPIGHADVYVNGISVKQPECRDRSISLECEHALSWRHFAESIKDDQAMIGRKCSSWDELKTGKCNGNETLVGYGISKDSRGLFLYKTKDVKAVEPDVRVYSPFDFINLIFR